LHNSFAFNSNGRQIEHITKTKCKEKKRKNKTKCEGPTNKSMKIPKYFMGFSDIEKGLV